jgi:NADH:ubiquinone oxidoreductase subunit F (NADH-binding)
MRYLAGESSAQCGPCYFGLRALAESCSRIAYEGANPLDIGRLERWSLDVQGRGGCRHPDGAVIFLRSALETFAPEFGNHTAHNARRSA